jgi:hypothetical protein
VTAKTKGQGLRMPGGRLGRVLLCLRSCASCRLARLQRAKFLFVFFCRVFGLYPTLSASQRPEAG